MKVIDKSCAPRAALSEEMFPLFSAKSSAARFGVHSSLCDRTGCSKISERLISSRALSQP